MNDQDPPRSGSRWEPIDPPARPEPSTGSTGAEHGRTSYAAPPLTVPVPPGPWQRLRDAARRPAALVGAGALGLALVAGGGFALGQVDTGHDGTPASSYSVGGDGDDDAGSHAPAGLPAGVPAPGDDDGSGAAGSGDRT